MDDGMDDGRIQGKLHLTCDGPDGWTDDGRMDDRTDSGEASFNIPTSFNICNGLVHN
jgi:hypothetical protein